jgi:hypothetical protein
MTEMAKRRTGGIPASALGDAAAAPSSQTPMAKARPRIARGELVPVFPYGEVWMQVLGSSTMEDIEAATFHAMAAKNLPPIDLHVGTYNLHRFRRILAAAVRNPKNHDEPFGTLEEWGEEPDEVLALAVASYKDVKQRLDPVNDAQLSQDDASALLEAFKKKDFQQLRSFGSVTLATWLLSGAVQLSSSPTPSSKSSESSAE